MLLEDMPDEQLEEFKGEPVVNRVARVLRSAIVDGRLKPGERIRQEQVAEACHTSRIPVREALRHLAAEGLVTLEPNVGARVRGLDISELDEVFLLRERVEPLAITLSAPNLTGADLDELRDLVSSMDPAAMPSEMPLWLELSRQFHMTAYSRAGMPRLLSLIEGLWDTLNRYRSVYFGGTSSADRLDLAQVEHRLILEALDRRDAQGAALLLEIHIRRVRLVVIPRERPSSNIPVRSTWSRR